MIYHRYLYTKWILKINIMGVPKNGWFTMETIIYKWMISGYPYFRKPPYIYTYIYI